MTFSDYIDGSGVRVFVCTGISDSVYASYREKMRGGDSISRVKSNKLPPRDNPYDAQRDLDAYAKEKGWSALPPGRCAEDRSGLRCLRKLLRVSRNKARHTRPAPVRDIRQRYVVKTHYSRSVEAHLAELRAYLTREGHRRKAGGRSCSALTLRSTKRTWCQGTGG